MANNVPRNVERQIENGVNTRGLDLKDVWVEEETSEGTVYRIVINDPDAEEGENPSFAIGRSSGGIGQNMFGDRLGNALDQVRNMIMGIEDETQQQLEETRQQLQESGHPGANNENVEYGPGPRPDLSTIQDDGYDDGDIRVQSTSEIDVPDVPASQSRDAGDRGAVNDGGGRSGETSGRTMGQQEHNETMNDQTQAIPDDFWGDIAEAALDARELEEKGHERAAKALLEDVQDDIDEYLESDE